MAAKKKDDEQVSMIGSFREFQDTKNIDRTTLVSVLEESFRNVMAATRISMLSSTRIRAISRSIATAWSWLTARWPTKTRK